MKKPIDCRYLWHKLSIESFSVERSAFGVRRIAYGVLRIARARTTQHAARSTNRRSGFVLILVIIAIAVIGIEMFALASVANTMQFQSHRAYLQACRRNLTASGLAWARQNIPDKAGESAPQAIKLDVGEMNVRGSDLELTISRPSQTEAEVLIKTSCSRGRQTLKGESRYKISL